MLRVENRNMKLFDRKILEPLPEDLMHIPRPPDRNSILTLFSRHSAAELKRRMNRDCSRVSYTFQCCKSRHRLRGQSPQRAMRARENLMAKLYR
jgi:hypothetical protein